MFMNNGNEFYNENSCNYANEEAALCGSDSRRGGCGNCCGNCNGNCGGNGGSCCCRGPAGPQGPRGCRGPMGPIGPMGPAGEMGLMGPMGPTGLTGATGPTGPAGATGLTGPTGPTAPYIYEKLFKAVYGTALRSDIIILLSRSCDDRSRGRRRRGVHFRADGRGGRSGRQDQSSASRSARYPPHRPRCR